MNRKERLDERRATLSPAKQALLAQRLAATGAGALSKRPDPTTYPLSFAQERLWFLAQLEPDSAIYHRPLLLRLTGALKSTRLAQALTEIVRRHEVLRATFLTVDGQPVQQIRPVEQISLPIVDLSEVPAGEREQRMNRLLMQEVQRPFDLAQTLLRATLLRLDQEEHILAVVIHHSAFDAWSAEIFIKELTAFYGATLASAAALPEPPIQVADFAHWQRQQLAGERLEKLLAYWQNQLADLQPCALPTDQPRSADQSGRAGQEFLQLPQALLNDLQALSQQAEATLFMTLLAAFQLLLSRYIGQDDIVVGAPVAGRTHLETEGVIGCFLNNLVLRADLSGNPTFIQLLAQVRMTTLEAYAHQELPFEKLVQTLNPTHTLHRTPIFQIFFNMVSLPMLDFKADGLTIKVLTQPRFHSPFDLTLYVKQQHSAASIELVYKVDLFTDARMQEMVAQFVHLLHQIAESPHQAINTYSLVTAQARTRLPDPTKVLPAPQHEPVTTSIAAWAKRTPHAVALVWDEHRLSYQALVEHSDALAALLLTAGLQKGEVVAILGARSIGLVVSIVAVWRSGGILLTVDPALPTARQQMIVREAGVTRIIAIGVDEEAIMQLSTPSEAACLPVIRVEPKDAKLPAYKLGDNWSGEFPQVDGDAAAYIFFTSGSTGTPKGILGNHKGLAHFLSWQRAHFSVGPGDRVGHLTALSFDVVLRDIFLPLTSGATLCIPTVKAQQDPVQLLAWLDHAQITLLHLVPTLAQSWLLEPMPTTISLASVRWFFFAGEPLKESLIQQWRKHFPTSGQIANFYGPTETTLAKFCYTVPDKLLLPGVQPIGNALPETQGLILSVDNRLCGIGEIGEIVVRTPFRTLGYINIVSENQQRFRHNPFLPPANAILFSGTMPATPLPMKTEPLSVSVRPLTDVRGSSYTSEKGVHPRENLVPEADLVYYTGDRGRYRPDGSLEILDRLDHQIKLRGVRIEPQEIEILLNQHPQLVSSVVVADEKREHLIAYVVAKPTQAPSADNLRHFLQSQLPPVMIPSNFVILASLPILASGKVDRRALAARPLEFVREQVYVAPLTPLEGQIANLWASLLGVTQVGVHDNFFALGGHSLLAVRLLAQIERKVGRDVPLNAFFNQPTIAHLAHLLATEATASAPELDLAQANLSTAQQAAVQAVIQQLADPTQPQRWRAMAGNRGWHRRRQVIHRALALPPYALTRWALTRVFQMPWLSTRCLHKEVTLTQQFLTELDHRCADEAAVISKCLLFNGLHYYGITPHATNVPMLVGQELLAAAQASGRGIIFVSMHDTLFGKFSHGLLAEAYPIGSIQNYLAYHQIQRPALEQALFAHQLHTARHILQAGGAVRISPDGHHGHLTGVEVDFHGRRRLFRSSFAELAFMTDATVLAVVGEVEPTGKTQVRLVGPLNDDDETASHAVRVERLVLAYVALLRRMWAETPWLVPWYQMERHLAYPPRQGS